MENIPLAIGFDWTFDRPFWKRNYFIHFWNGFWFLPVDFSLTHIWGFYWKWTICQIQTEEKVEVRHQGNSRFQEIWGHWYFILALWDIINDSSRKKIWMTICRNDKRVKSRRMLARRFYYLHLILRCRNTLNFRACLYNSLNIWKWIIFTAKNNLRSPIVTIVFKLIQTAWSTSLS